MSVTEALYHLSVLVCLTEEWHRIAFASIRMAYTTGRCLLSTSSLATLNTVSMDAGRGTSTVPGGSSGESGQSLSSNGQTLITASHDLYTRGPFMLWRSFKR